MTDPYDALVQRAIAHRLSLVPPARVRSRTPKRSPRGPVAAALAAILALSGALFASEVNAAAEAEGMGCVDALTKVQVWVAEITNGKVTLVGARPTSVSVQTYPAPVGEAVPAVPAVPGAHADGEAQMARTGAGCVLEIK